MVAGVIIVRHALALEVAARPHIDRRGLFIIGRTIIIITVLIRDGTAKQQATDQTSRRTTRKGAVAASEAPATVARMRPEAIIFLSMINS